MAISNAQLQAAFMAAKGMGKILDDDVLRAIITAASAVADLSEDEAKVLETVLADTRAKPSALVIDRAYLARKSGLFIDVAARTADGLAKRGLIHRGKSHDNRIFYQRNA